MEENCWPFVFNLGNIYVVLFSLQGCFYYVWINVKQFPSHYGDRITKDNEDLHEDFKSLCWKSFWGHCSLVISIHGICATISMILLELIWTSTYSLSSAWFWRAMAIATNSINRLKEFLIWSLNSNFIIIIIQTQYSSWHISSRWLWHWLLLLFSSSCAHSTWWAPWPLH